MSVYNWTLIPVDHLNGVSYETVQFIWSELFYKFSSFKRTVGTVQLICSELFQKFI